MVWLVEHKLIVAVDSFCQLRNEKRNYGKEEEEKAGDSEILVYPTSTIVVVENTSTCGDIMDDLKKAIIISFAGGLACGFSVGCGVGYVIGSGKKSRIENKQGYPGYIVWWIPPSLTQNESYLLLASSAVLTALIVPLIALDLQRKD